MWGAAKSSIICQKKNDLHTQKKNNCKITFILKACYLNKFIKKTIHSEKSSKIAPWKQKSLPYILLGLIWILNWARSESSCPFLNSQVVIVAFWGRGEIFREGVLGIILCYEFGCYGHFVFYSIFA